MKVLQSVERKKLLIDFNFYALSNSYKKKKKNVKIQYHEVANYFVKLHSSNNNIDTVWFNFFVSTIICTIKLVFFSFP